MLARSCVSDNLFVRLFFFFFSVFLGCCDVLHSVCSQRVLPPRTSMDFRPIAPSRREWVCGCDLLKG